MTDPESGSPERIRIDKWLWAARMFKTRALAADAVRVGRIELNGNRTKPSKPIGVGDRLTVRKNPFVFHIEVHEVSARRRPATEAQSMYRETQSSFDARQLMIERLRAESAAQSDVSKGRPTKRDRRRIVRFQRQSSN